MKKMILFKLVAGTALTSWGLLSSAAPGDVYCFGLVGNRTVIASTVELKPRVDKHMNVVEYNGQNNSYEFHARVSGNSVVLAISQNQMLMSGPAVELQPLLKEPLILGLLSPAQVLTFYNPADEKTPSAYVGCGIE